MVNRKLSSWKPRSDRGLAHLLITADIIKAGTSTNPTNPINKLVMIDIPSPSTATRKKGGYNPEHGARFENKP
jgi:hypothetical protein